MSGHPTRILFWSAFISVTIHLGAAGTAVLVLPRTQVLPGEGVALGGGESAMVWLQAPVEPPPPPPPESPLPKPPPETPPTRAPEPRSPEPPPVRLGLDSATKLSETWIGSDQPGENAGRLSTVEQPLLRRQPGGDGGSPSPPPAPLPAPPAASAPAPAAAQDPAPPIPVSAEPARPPSPVPPAAPADPPTAPPAEPDPAPSEPPAATPQNPAPAPAPPAPAPPPPLPPPAPLKVEAPVPAPQPPDGVGDGPKPESPADAKPERAPDPAPSTATDPSTKPDGPKPSPAEKAPDKPAEPVKGLDQGVNTVQGPIPDQPSPDGPESATTPPASTPPPPPPLTVPPVPAEPVAAVPDRPIDKDREALQLRPPRPLAPALLGPTKADPAAPKPAEPSPPAADQQPPAAPAPAPTPPPDPEALRRELLRQLRPVSPPQPVQRPAVVQRPGQPGSGKIQDDGAWLAEKDSDPTSVRRVAQYRSGAVTPGKGFEIYKIVRPEIGVMTRMMGASRNPTYDVLFRKNGEVARVEPVRSSGNPTLDDNIVSSIYFWRARGQDLDNLGPGDKATLTVRLNFILFGE